MSEPVDQSVNGESVPTEASAAAVQAGLLLRQAREAHGLHVAAMAFSLKVPVNKLEALEAGRLDLLPDLVFARGLAASVCRNLKIDPAPVLELLPRHGAARVGVTASSINAPFRAPVAGANFSPRGRIFSPAVWIVLVLLVGALVLLLVPKAREELETAAEPPAPPVMEIASAPTAAAEAAPASPSSAPMNAAPVGGTALAAASPNAPPATTSPASPASSSMAAASASAGDGLFVLSAKGESWVKVTDAKGMISLNRLVQAGEVVQATGAVPLSVVVGRADMVQVQVRGKAMDLTPMTKVNVARFEVK